MWITFLAFTWILREGVSVQAPVSIQPFSFPASVVKGQSVTLTCAVSTGTEPFAFRWTRDGRPLDELPLTRVQTADEYSLLSLKAVDGDRAGDYTCLVTNAAGSANHTATLTVHEYPEWTIVPADVEAVRGSDVLVPCSASGVPAPLVQWTKRRSSEDGPSEVVSSATGGRHRVSSNGSLWLEDVHTNDAGQYECRVHNGIGEGLAKLITLQVHEPPSFKEAYQVLRVKSSHSAVLRCEVSGDPPLVVRWTREYATDEHDDRYKIQETPLPNGLLSELYIARVVRQDAGLFVCVATNAYGKKEKTLKLVVLEPPSSPSDIVLRNIDRNVAAVHWTEPYSGNSPVTRYIVQYWKDTGAPPKLEEATVASDKTSAQLRGLRPGTSYVVRVIAENEFGASTPSVPVRFDTAEDNPSGYPTDLAVFPRGPHDLIVRWKAPAPDQRNGAIQGYELGYRERDSKAPYVYREAPSSAGLSHEFVVDQLRENTEYEVVVRAYNRAGRGPASVPVVARTREKGNLAAPNLWVESTSASSILLRWSGNEEINTNTLRHTVHYRAEGDKWTEKVVPTLNAESYLLAGLEENTLYHVYLQAATGNDRSEPSATLHVRTSDPSFERSSMTQVREVSHQTTLVISLSVVVSCVVIVCVVAGACVYVTRVTTGVAMKQRDGRMAGEFLEPPSTSRSTPLSRHTSNFRYVDVNSRPLLWCSTPAPPNDYPSPYATLPLRATPLSKRWHSDDGLSPAISERSESLVNQRVEMPDEKSSTARE